MKEDLWINTSFLEVNTVQKNKYREYKKLHEQKYNKKIIINWIPKYSFVGIHFIFMIDVLETVKTNNSPIKCNSLLFVWNQIKIPNCQFEGIRKKKDSFDEEMPNSQIPKWTPQSSSNLTTQKL